MATTFKQFLTEADDRNDIHLPEEIKSQIGPYLNIVKKNHPLLRGINADFLRGIEPIATIDSGDKISSYSDGNIGIKILELTTQTNRQPKDMSPEMSRRVDDWFENNFGTRVRQQSVFCFSSVKDTGMAVSDAQYYGVPCAIAPSGKFTYIWSPKYDDLYASLHRDVYYTTDSKLADDLESGDYVANIGINEAPHGHEIMVQCQRYYAAHLYQHGGDMHGAPITVPGKVELEYLAKVFWS